MLDWKLVYAAIDEDMPLGDASARWVRPVTVHAVIQAREAARVCGTHYIQACFDTVAQRLGLAPAQIALHCQDGDDLAAGATVATLQGHAHVIMAAERPALNFLMRISGLATHALTLRRGAPARITLLDTRKTTPGWRAVEKYAFRMGGLCNHRMSLSESAMLKDSHRDFLRAPTDIAPRGPLATLEIEIDTPDQISRALSYGPDALLLDNFAPATLKHALERIPDHIRVEVSGNVQTDQLASLPERVRYVSLGRALQAFQWIDFGLDIVTAS